MQLVPYVYKYKVIWICYNFQEELLTEDMISCDVSKKSRYGVESYDYTIKYRLDDAAVSKKVFTNNFNCNDNDRVSNKRSRSDRANGKLRLVKLRLDDDREEIRIAKHLPDLAVAPEDPIESIALDIADKLSEDKKDLVGM